MSNLFPKRDPNLEPNAEFVKELKNGLLFLWDGCGDIRPCGEKGGLQEYICYTIDSAVLKGIIQERLICGTYRNWRERNEKQLYSNGLISYKVIQAGRKAWMLDLIEEFS